MSAGEHEHEHEHGHEHGHDHHDTGEAKDPVEQEALARDLGEDLIETFVAYVRGEIEYADLTFQAFETLHDLHIIASGAYELEYDEDEEPEGEGAGEYDAATATAQQEDLAQEPAGP